MSDTEKIADAMTQLTAALITVIVESTEAIARNSGGSVSKHLIAVELEKQAGKLPIDQAIAKAILGSVASRLEGRQYPPVTIQIAGK